MAATTVVLVEVITGVVIVEMGAAIVEVTTARENLEAQKLCATAIPATSEAMSLMIPPHEAAETDMRRRKEYINRFWKTKFILSSYSKRCAISKNGC